MNGTCNPPSRLYAIAAALILTQLAAKSAVVTTYVILDGMWHSRGPSAARNIQEFAITVDAYLGPPTSFLSLCLLFFFARFAQAVAEDGAIPTGWTVGWYFVPIYNLWKPYSAYSKVWRACSDEEPPLKLWWGLWLAANAMMSTAVAMTSHRQIELMNEGRFGDRAPVSLADEFWIASDVAWCLALLAFLRVLAKTHRAQQALAMRDTDENQ